MTTEAARAALSVTKARQQKTWASGDYAVVASRIVLASELLADAAGLMAGWEVLDVACGNGNAALAAARSGTRVLGIDYVPELLEGGRARAVAEGLDVEFRLGDVEDLPVEDASFDAVLSVFGAMFAPDHQRAANEIIRAARPGGTVGLASWTPDGFIGQMFDVIARHVPAPPGVASPLLWGTEEHVHGLFGAAATDARSVLRTCTWRFTSPEQFVSFFRRWYGPALKAFEALDSDGRAALTADLHPGRGRSRPALNCRAHASAACSSPFTPVQGVRDQAQQPRRGRRLRRPRLDADRHGVVFTTRLSGGKGGRNGFEHELRRLGVIQRTENRTTRRPRAKSSSSGRP
jgi:ubiquinone/menaquinone biosynthesis C-methylase UbiE